MMIKSVLLASIGLVGIVQARTYAVVRGKIVECPWDARWSDFDVVAHLIKAGASWNDLHFDQVQGPMEALLLPEDFWANALSPAQTMEIILNPYLQPMLLKEENFWPAVEGRPRSSRAKTRQKFFGLGRARKSVGRKLRHFRDRIKGVDPIVAGSQADQVMNAIPPETYKHTSPLLATLSRGFRATKKNVAKLFGFTLKGLRAALPYLIPVVLTVLRLILTALISSALGVGGLGLMGGIVGLGSMFSSKSGAPPSTQLGPLYIAQLLLDLLSKYPVLDLYIGDRVRLLVAELERVMARLRSGLHKADQKIRRFNKHCQLKAKEHSAEEGDSSSSSADDSPSPGDDPGEESDEFSISDDDDLRSDHHKGSGSLSKPKRGLQDKHIARGRARV